MSNSTNKTKAGYIAIIGKPNAGKSTLMNCILESKISIVTDKPQTTRKRVLGIYSKDNVQMVFLDTPGVLKPRYELQKNMMEYVDDALITADILAVLVDLSKFDMERNYFHSEFLEKIKSQTKPKVLILNKIDTFKNVKNILPVIKYFADMKIFDEIIPISALKNSEIQDLLKVLEQHLPEGEFYFDPELLSTLNERFFVSEIIREHIFKDFYKEVPYSTEVNIVEFKEREKGKWYISAEIIVERNSQKTIMIGENGAKIKEIGERSRRDIEEHLQTEIFLELFVKVRENWRNDKNMLKSFGY